MTTSAGTLISGEKYKSDWKDSKLEEQSRRVAQKHAVSQIDLPPLPEPDHREVPVHVTVAKRTVDAEPPPQNRNNRQGRPLISWWWPTA